MLKKTLLMLLVISTLSCHKNQQSACGTGQVCTAIYAYITIGYKYKSDTTRVFLESYSAINQRTHLPVNVEIKQSLPASGAPAIIVATDDMRDQFSTEGDDVLITIKDLAKHQTQTATVKISGGCNCHVAKLSGPDSIIFD